MLIIRITSLISIFVSFVLGAIFSKKKNTPRYYYCVLMGIVSQLLAYIYYFAMEVNPDIHNIFTLGIFGEVSFYLFIYIGNCKEIPTKDVEDNKPQLSLVGLLGAIVTLLILILSCAFDPSVETIVSCVLSLSICTCIYSSFSNIQNVEKNKYKNSIKISNIIIAIICITNCLIQLMVSLMVKYPEANANWIFAFILYGVFDIAHILLPIILRKEIKAWIN